MKIVEANDARRCGPPAIPWPGTSVQSPADMPALWPLLEQQGVVLVQAETGDSEGRILRQIVTDLGTAEPHDAGRQDVWDIRYDSVAAHNNGTRSLTMKAFPFHTDGSFEDPPPRYLAMYVVQEDRFGAGRTLLVETGAVLQHVSAEAQQVLRSMRFRFRVPAEFDKGIAFRDVFILLGDGLLRYRREIIQEGGCVPKQLAALDKLDAAIASIPPTELFLKSGMLLLLDNARFLHARTEVRDPARHLLRMRFSSREN